MIETIKNCSLENESVLVTLYKPEMAKKIEPIFYEEILVHLEIILDEKKSKFDAYIDFLNEIYTNHSKTYTFLCIDKKTGNVAGCTQLKYIDPINLKLEMGGTWYGKKYQGTGLNQASKLLLFDFCFNQLKIRRIQFSVDSDNISSKKSMTKIGATFEGHFRNNWIDQQGKSRDDDYYSIISEDWEEIKYSCFEKYL